MKYIDTDKLLAVLERQNTDKKIIQSLIRIITSLQQEQLSTSLCGRVSNDGEYPPGLILGSEQLHSCLKRFPDDTYVDIFIIAKKDK